MSDLERVIAAALRAHRSEQVYRKPEVAIAAAVRAHIEQGLDAAYYEMGEHIALEAAPDTLAAALRALDLLPDPQGEEKA